MLIPKQLQYKSSKNLVELQPFRQLLRPQLMVSLPQKQIKFELMIYYLTKREKKQIPETEMCTEKNRLISFTKMTRNVNVKTDKIAICKGETSPKKGVMGIEHEINRFNNDKWTIINNITNNVKLIINKTVYNIFCVLL